MVQGVFRPACMLPRGSMCFLYSMMMHGVGSVDL